MATENDRSQADSLPEDMTFAEEMREGMRRMVVPANAIWDHFFDSPGTDLGPRDQPQAQKREAF